MDNDRPIIFTVSEKRTSLFNIKTQDPRGSEENVYSVYENEIYKTELDITEALNGKGYAVLFEID